ncbi:MAG: non-canonical purine NTP pyrophosphatase [Synergistaceae bacterium]|nr:non-canonical purine NTP pyrophosphatase [Synergistaceae bacterium]
MTASSEDGKIFRLILASGNRDKQTEFAGFFRAEGMPSLGFALAHAQSMAMAAPDVEESGQSYEENALLKARAWADRFGMPALADDSGLEVHSLGGRPGIFSARAAPGKDADRVNWLLGELEGVPDRRACFVACLVVAFPAWQGGGRGYFASEGRCFGKIACQPAGAEGFGYDPVFIPDGHENTFAELGSEVKSMISHRAKAMGGMALMAASVKKYWSLCEQALL